jgi:hypothetical protein
VPFPGVLIPEVYSGQNKKLNETGFPENLNFRGPVPEKIKKCVF